MDQCRLSGENSDREDINFSNFDIETRRFYAGKLQNVNGHAIINTPNEYYCFSGIRYKGIRAIMVH